MAIASTYKYNAPSLGLNGSTLFTDTTARTGSWFAITVIADAVFTLLTDATRGGTALAADTFPAGVTIYGQFTAITLASGKIIAYKA
jgi:hypothetical protein